MKKTVIFMGTPEIAVPSLQALIDAGYDVPLVLSQPDKPKGRGNKVQMTPVKELAVSKGIEVYQPERFKNNKEVSEKLRSYNPDFFAVVAYGKILPEEILKIPSFACINVHFSILPLYRGAAPVNWAVINGDQHTGVTTMKMDAGMDTGDILMVKTTPILKKSSLDLSLELSLAGAELLVDTIEGYDEIVPVPQGEGATHAPMMKKEDGLIDWSMPAAQIERIIRGFVPWPAAYTYLGGKLLKIFKAEINNSVNGSPGTIEHIGKNCFTVGTGEGGLIVYEIQMEGKRRMTVSDFLAGYKISAGAKLDQNAG